MPAPKIPLRMTSYFAQVNDHYVRRPVGWFTCNPGGCRCVCKPSYCYEEGCTDDEYEEYDTDPDEDTNLSQKQKASSCFTTTIAWIPRGNDVRYAVTQKGERKAMTRCIHGNESSMKDFARDGLPKCRDAHYLIDGDQVIIDFLNEHPNTPPHKLRKCKHVRIHMSRGTGLGPAVGYRDFSNREFKLEVDTAANVTLCKMKRPKRRRRRWTHKVDSDVSSCSDDESDASDVDEFEEFDGSGPTPNQTTMYCNEFCRALIYEAPRLRCFYTQAMAAKMRYNFSLSMFAKCILKWKQLHIRCVGKNWAPGGAFYNELLKGSTARTMSAAPCTEEKKRKAIDMEERKEGTERKAMKEFHMPLDLIIERPMSA